MRKKLCFYLMKEANIVTKVALTREGLRNAEAPQGRNFINRRF